MCIIFQINTKNIYFLVNKQIKALKVQIDNICSENIIIQTQPIKVKKARINYLSIKHNLFS